MDDVEDLSNAQVALASAPEQIPDEPYKEIPSAPQEDQSFTPASLENSRATKKSEGEKTVKVTANYAPTGMPISAQEAAEQSKPGFWDALNENKVNTQKEFLGSFLDWKENAQYIKSLGDQGAHLTKEQLATSVYNRPGLTDKYPAGVSEGQAKALSQQYDIEQSINKQLNQLGSVKKGATSFLGSTEATLSDPIGLALTLGTGGLGRIGGSLVGTFTKFPLLNNAIGQAATKIAGGAAGGAIGMAAFSSVPIALRSKGYQDLDGGYTYLQAQKDLISQSEYGAAFGGGLSTLGVGLSFLKGRRPSEAIAQEANNIPKEDLGASKQNFSQNVKQAESEILHTADFERPPKMDLQPLPEDLQEKYGTHEGREPNATPKQLKGAQVELARSNEELPSPTDNVASYGYKEEQPVTEREGAIKELQQMVDAHQNNFSEMKEEDLSALPLSDVPEQLARSKYGLKKYLEEEKQLPYLNDAIKYLQNPESSKPRLKRAYEAIKNNNEETIIDDYISKTEKNIERATTKGDTAQVESLENSLQALHERKEQLTKLKDFTKSLDDIHDQTQKVKALKEKLVNPDEQKFSGKFLVSPTNDFALMNKADIDNTLDKDINVHTTLTKALQESPLLNGKEIPEGFEDLKSHLDNTVITSDEIKSEYESAKAEEDLPYYSDAQAAEDQHLNEQSFEALPEDIKAQAEKVPEPQTIKDYAQQVLKCLLGESE